MLTNPPATTNPEVVPTEGGTLTVGIDGESSGYSPQVDPWAHGGHIIARAVFDTLAAYDVDGRAVPYLAESITANPEATVWTIVLRPGISFHNGEPLNADAVRLNFEAVKASAQFKDTLSLLASMAVVDDLTLELTMNAPWGSFPNVLTGGFAGQVGYIAAPAMLADPAGGRSPIGTGPFEFVEWVPDDHLTVARNDDYWQGAPYLDGVEFRPIADSTSRAGGVRRRRHRHVLHGHVERDRRVPRDAGGRRRPRDGRSAGRPRRPAVQHARSLRSTTCAVRRRSVMALDFDRLFDFLDGDGVKRMMHGPYADSSFWYVDTGYPDFDPAAAAALVEEYEAEVGPIVFDYAGNQDPFIVSYQELIQSMWAEVGIEANIVSRCPGREHLGGARRRLPGDRLGRSRR